MSVLSQSTVKNEEVVFSSNKISGYSSTPEFKRVRKSANGSKAAFGMFMYFVGLIVVGVVTLVISMRGGDYGDGILTLCLVPSVFGFLLLSTSSN